MVTSGPSFIDIERRGGIYSSGSMAWAFMMADKKSNRDALKRDDWDEVAAIRPIKDIPQRALGRNIHLYKNLYIHSSGNARTSSGDGIITITSPWNEPFDTYVFNPEDPAPFLIDVSENEMNVPENYREVDKRDDVLVYNSSPLKRDIAIAGNIYAEIYAASSARDTDWLVRLEDVDADGNSIRLTDGILRARILIAKILSTPLFSKLKSLFRC